MEKWDLFSQHQTMFLSLSKLETAQDVTKIYQDTIRTVSESLSQHLISQLQVCSKIDLNKLFSFQRWKK